MLVELSLKRLVKKKCEENIDNNDRKVFKNKMLIDVRFHDKVKLF